MLSHVFEDALGFYLLVSWSFPEVARVVGCPSMRCSRWRTPSRNCLQRSRAMKELPLREADRCPSSRLRGDWWRAPPLQPPPRHRPCPHLLRTWQKQALIRTAAWRMASLLASVMAPLPSLQVCTDSDCQHLRRQHRSRASMHRLASELLRLKKLRCKPQHHSKSGSRGFAVPQRHCKWRKQEHRLAWRARLGSSSRRSWRQQDNWLA